MTIPLESVEAGKCYLTNTGRVWRIMRILPDGRVQYEHRADIFVHGDPKPGMLTTLPAEVEIEREVPCDWSSSTDRAAAVSIPPESIQVDRCYLTESGSIRKVTSTGSDGQVRYRERAGAGPWLSGETNKRKRHVFAAAIVREVPCDWTPEGE
jgi:hypothetical protein